MREQSKRKRAEAEQEWWEQYLPSGYRLRGWTKHIRASLDAPDGRPMEITGDHVDWAIALKTVDRRELDEFQGLGSLDPGGDEIDRRRG